MGDHLTQGYYRVYPFHLDLIVVQDQVLKNELHPYVRGILLHPYMLFEGYMG